MAIKHTPQIGVDTSNVKMLMNPFCEIALEEALRIKESGLASEAVAVRMGPAQYIDTLCIGLAMEPPCYPRRLFSHSIPALSYQAA